MNLTAISFVGVSSNGLDDTLNFDNGALQTINWMAARCRQIAAAHMSLAVKAEELTERLHSKSSSRRDLRSFARHHRRMAWQQLEIAWKIETDRNGDCPELDRTFKVSV
jgi:hypothetical protein